MKKSFVAVALAVLSSATFADCKGVWEVGTLAATKESHILLSDVNLPYAFNAEYIGNLSSVHQRIDEASGVPTRFLLCNSDEPNVFSWKEGDQNVTAITLGMTSRLGDSLESYAAVLAHENAHLAKNHTPKISPAHVGNGALMVLFRLGAVLGSKGQTGESLVSDISSLSKDAFSGAYTPAQESEAQVSAQEYLQRAGYISDWRDLEKKLHNSSKYYKTHPLSNPNTTTQTVNP